MTTDNARLPSRFLMLSNMVPRVADPSGALSGRFVMLVLKNSFFGREDPNLTDKLLTELPGILLWALEGWSRLQAQGCFSEPSSSAEALGLLHRLTSPIMTFLDDRCVLGEREDVSVEELFNEWRSWCLVENRIFPGTKESFAQQLHAAVPGLSKIRRRKNSARPYYYSGIGISHPLMLVEDRESAFGEA